MPPPSAVPTPGQAAELERLVYAFDQAWQGGAPPRIETFWTPAAGTPLLTELVKIDLERRWRRPGAGPADLPARPRLEDYVARYPQLGPIGQIELPLIEEEYRVRRCWGDQPGHAEYQARFGRHGAALIQALTRIDAELRAEFAAAPGDSGVAGGPKVDPTPCQATAAVPRPPAPAAVTTAVRLFDTLRQHQLLKPSQQKDIARELRNGRFPDARTLAGELVRRGMLTPFQANQAFQGHAAALVLGPYVLQQRLGEGGTGEVFAARHRHLDRLVALKQLRKDLLTDQEAVTRFQREVHVVSQLADPHVVHAYDAGPVGTNYFLAMEYVEGIDLHRLVRQNGPLPAPVALEYVRQAALGLRCIHEHGLVHRDIKPSNLIVTKAKGSKAQGAELIKILDLGLARLHRPIDEATAAVTGASAVLMGTLDYMAPEQALDFHNVDIRADIYSLGCTLYYLLTGQPPFPGGTLAHKVLRQQQAQPQPIEQLRPDLPAALPQLLNHMMAKQPEARYQSPAELGSALGALLTGSIPAMPVPAAPGRKPGQAAPVAAGVAEVAVAATLPTALAARKRDRFGRMIARVAREMSSRPRLLGSAGVLLAVLVLAALFLRPAREDNFEGRWKVVAQVYDGVRTPDATLESMRIVVNRERQFTTWQGQTVLAKGRTSYDPTKRPRTFDSVLEDGTMTYGIYEVDGNTVKYCYVLGGKSSDRPADFVSKPGDRRYIEVLQRVKE
jgi:uncharacterized protein (TIGR03067 family)